VATLITTPGPLTGTFAGIPDGTTVPIFGCLQSRVSARINYTAHTATATIVPPVAVGVAPPPPVLGKSVDVQTVSGQVFVKLPPGAKLSAAPSPPLKGQGFVPLARARQIPVGSILDTTDGTVRLTAATPTPSRAQSGDFSAGTFRVTQARKQRGLTDLRLIDARSARQVCVPAGRARTARRGLSRKVLALLRARVHGRFSTRGTYSSVAARGTSWSMADRCDGTLTRVTRGVVVVRDLRLRRNMTLRAGRSYLAKAPGA
jgi:hypothetical protein